MQKQEKVIIISAPSGAGKTTIVRELMKDNNLNLMFSVSATSRPPRNNEKNGKDYFFLSIEDFKQQIKNNNFVEWEEVYKNQFYGTLKNEVNRIWNLNKNIIFDVDVKGGISLKKEFSDKSISIFIKPPSIKELKNRLLNRGTETEASIKKRIEKAEYELTFINKFDNIIINDNLQTAILQTKQLIINFINS